MSKHYLGRCEGWLDRSVLSFSLLNILSNDNTANIYRLYLLQSLRIIFSISFFNLPYISFLRYFGANTIWYWHQYVECDNVFISLFPSFFILFLTSCILVMRLPNHLHFTWRFSFFQYVFRLTFSSPFLFLLKCFIFPDWTGVFLFAEGQKWQGDRRSPCQNLRRSRQRIRYKQSSVADDSGGLLLNINYINLKNY